MVNFPVFSIYNFWSIKIIFTKLLLDKEMNDAGFRRYECFQNYDI